MQGQQATKPVRVGVVGLGMGSVHLRTYAKMPGVRVVALAGQEEERLAELGKTYEVPNLYRDYEDMLKRDDLDAISICVPNALHPTIAIAALERGIHVLCEKPLARTGEEAQRMVEVATKANRVLQVVFNKRSSRDVLALRNHIASGGLGKVYYAKAFWMRRNVVPAGWFASKELAGGGPLIDLGVHMLEMALYLLGDPEVVSITASTYSDLVKQKRAKLPDAKPFEVEDLATAFIRLANSSTLLLEASWATHSSFVDDYGVTLFGTEGGAEFKVNNYSVQDTLRFYQDVAGAPADIKSRMSGDDGVATVIKEFISIINSGSWSQHNGQRGLYLARLMDACYESAREGREVVLTPDASIR